MPPTVLKLPDFLFTLLVVAPQQIIKNVRSTKTRKHTHTERRLQLPGPRIPASRYSSTGSAYGLTIGGFKHTCTKCAYVHTYSIHTHIQSFPDRHMHQVHRRQWQTHCQKNASGLRHTLVCLQMTLTKTQRMNVCQDDHRGLYLP